MSGTPASVTPGAGRVPKAGPDGTLDPGWLPPGGGTGDMLAAVFDPDGDGKIDIAQTEGFGTAAALDVPASGAAASGQVVKGDDPRLTDARTPTAHAASHGSGGGDAITIAESQVTGLVTDLAAKAPLDSPALTGTPTAPTVAGATDASTKIATTAFVQACVAALINSAPGALDTLGELAAALAADESTAAALATTVAGKLAKSANLSDLTDPAAARAALSLGTAALLAASAVLQAANNLSELTDTTAARANLELGALATKATAAESDLSISDNTTGNVSTTAHGFAPKAPSDATKFLDGTGAWSTPSGGSSAGLDGEFGSADDGSATLDGTTTVSGTSKSGSVYTLSRDCTFDTLTVNSGVTLKTAGFRLYANAIVNNGTISNDGGNGGNASGTNSATGGTAGSASGGGASAAFGAGGVGVAGASGTTTNGAQSAANANQASGLISRSGGQGAAGGAGASGTAGASAGGVTSVQKGTHVVPLIALVGATQITSGAIGACGGGSGGGDSTNAGGGGGGGGGGGVVVIYAKDITVGATGVISALGGNGGNGGSPTTGNCGGGGGGGGGCGGVVALFYKTLTITAGGSISVAGGSGGAAGTKVGTGSNGSAGGSGPTGLILKRNAMTGGYDP